MIDISASRDISGSSHRGAKKTRVPSDLIRLSHRYRGLRTVGGDHDTFGEVGRYYSIECVVLLMVR